MTIIALETARDACSVALMKANSVVASMTLLKPRSHAENLVPMVAETVRRAGTTLSKVQAVAVSAGPGSYTGLRIGVSTAKGLCLAHGAQLIGVPTLAAYARAIQAAARLDGWSPQRVLVVVGSRRDEVYYGSFEGSTLAQTGSTSIVPVAEAARYVDQSKGTEPAALGGDASQAVMEHVSLKEKATVVHFLPLADYVAVLGSEALQRGEEDDLDRFEPYYLKDYVARRPSGTIFDRLDL